MRKRINMCAGKQSFKSKAAARDSVTQLNKNNSKHRVKAYKCAVCQQIHFGHDSKRSMLDKSKKVEGYIHKSKKHKVKFDNVKNLNHGRSAES